MNGVETSIYIDKNRVTGNVSETLYGIFLEDINYSCDGGLNANMLRNYSFDDCYMKGKHLNMLRFVTHTAGRVKTLPDRLRYWECRGGNLISNRQEPVSEGTWYATCYSDGRCILTNKGYNGKNHSLPAIAIKEDAEYECSFYLRKHRFEGAVLVAVKDAAGGVLTSIEKIYPNTEWTFHKLILKGTKDGRGEFCITFEGKGEVDIDCVTFMDSDFWGAGDARWSQGRMRKDLVEALKELKPTFMRFPGGCLVEGVEDGNEYQWKQSVGPIIERHQDYNLWATEDDDSGYIQSRQLGFYEFFLLCEDLQMEPLPIVWAGLNCQMRRRGKVKITDPDFHERVVQNALDLIEYANGDPATSKWARIRAEAGHPEPFHLKYIGIGNENYGKDYQKRFDIVKAAIDEKYPGITCILSCGGMANGKDFDETWQYAKEKHPDVYIDEHMYKKPSSYIEQETRYDNYDRNTAKVFLGEYAAYDILKRDLIPNQYDTALAEAAFLCGVERNSDVVKMTCYAPLFALIDGQQWRHNLIYYNPSTLVKSTNYYVQQLFGANIGTKILKVEADKTEKIRFSATAKDDSIILKLVNITPKCVGVKVNIENFTPNMKQVTYMATDDLTSRNTIDFVGDANYTVVPIREEKVVKVEEAGTDVIELLPNSVYVIEYK